MKATIEDLQRLLDEGSEKRELREAKNPGGKPSVKGVRDLFLYLVQGRMPAHVVLNIWLDGEDGIEKPFQVSGSLLKVGNWLEDTAKNHPDIAYSIQAYTSDRNEARKKAQEV